MARIQALRFLGLAACVALVGCGNLPTGLGKVPPRQNAAAAFGNTPNYSAVDKYSFLQAEVNYPATGGDHRIEVGAYLLGEVFEIVKAVQVKQLRLALFDSKCVPSGMFAPHAMCSASYAIDFDDGNARRVEGAVGPVDIGNMIARESFPFTLGDRVFHERLTPLLLVIVDDMRIKLVGPTR